MLTEQDSALIAEIGMALCQSALGPKQCPCSEKGVFSCADAYPGEQAQAILPIIHRLTTEAHDAGVAAERVRHTQGETAAKPACVRR